MVLWLCTQVVDEARRDVSAAVGIYEMTGKVATSVLEASIFRKPYYLGYLLPAILKPRHVSLTLIVKYTHQT